MSRNKRASWLRRDWSRIAMTGRLVWSFLWTFAIQRKSKVWMILRLGGHFFIYQQVCRPDTLILAPPLVSRDEMIKAIKNDDSTTYKVSRVSNPGSSVAIKTTIWSGQIGRGIGHFNRLGCVSVWCVHPFKTIRSMSAGRRFQAFYHRASSCMVHYLSLLITGNGCLPH